MSYNVEEIRKEFPILGQSVYNKPIAYFDNAATTQKPRLVIDAIKEYYERYNSNIHRGVHYLSEKMTEAYESSRETIQKFINAKQSKEVIFTSGTTASINLIAATFSEAFLNEGDEIVVSTMEHHSNIVPWQLACEKKKAILKVIPISKKGELDLNAFVELLNASTKFISIAHVSNSLGTINNVKYVIDEAHKRNIPVLLDAAQSVQHISIDVQELDCDFLAFSGHKIYGPTGIGILYGKEAWLQKLPPFLGGGDMIKKVSFEKTTYADLPFKFEAGTMNFIGAVGLAAAIKFIESIGLENIRTYEDALLKYAHDRMSSIPKLKFIGQAQKKTSVVSFLLGDIHPFDTGMILDKYDVAVRTGHHCTQPLMDFLGIDGTVRASIAMYNTESEVEILMEGIQKVLKMFGK